MWLKPDARHRKKRWAASHIERFSKLTGRGFDVFDVELARKLLPHNTLHLSVPVKIILTLDNDFSFAIVIMRSHWRCYPPDKVSLVGNEDRRPTRQTATAFQPFQQVVCLVVRSRLVLAINDNCNSLCQENWDHPRLEQWGRHGAHRWTTEISSDDIWIVFHVVDFHQVFQAHFPMLVVDEDNSALLVVDGNDDLLLNAVLHPLVGVGVLWWEELGTQWGFSHSNTSQH